ncbi:MAG TPA: cytochrome c [Blastocatellia bacterium]|nr:cytochrome c [Blastocatellia bacterium]
MKTLALRLTFVAATTIGLIFSLASTARIDSSQGEIDAKKIFEKNCSGCHGKDGRAKTFHGKIVGARNLTDETWQSKATDEEIKNAIKKGPGAMPSFEKKFSEAEIDALVAYVRHFKGTAPKK